MTDRKELPPNGKWARLILYSASYDIGQLYLGEEKQKFDMRIPILMRLQSRQFKFSDVIAKYNEIKIRTLSQWLSVLCREVNKMINFRILREQRWFKKRYRQLEKWLNDVLNAYRESIGLVRYGGFIVAELLWSAVLDTFGRLSEYKDSHDPEVEDRVFMCDDKVYFCVDKSGVFLGYVIMKFEALRYMMDLTEFDHDYSFPKWIKQQALSGKTNSHGDDFYGMDQLIDYLYQRFHRDADECSVQEKDHVLSVMVIQHELEVRSVCNYKEWHLLKC